MQTILTPLDGSKHGQMALAFAEDLAARYDARLILLHVAGGSSGLPQSLYDTAAKAFQASKAAPAAQDEVAAHVGQEILQKGRESARDKAVRQIETVLAYGDPSDEILRQATDCNADLIVMGSRGFGALKGLVLGSVSHKVFHKAPCSCVTISHSDEKPDLAGIENILVPTDGSAQADKAVALAAEIADKYGARLALLHVMWRGPSLDQLRRSVDMNQLSEKARDELDPEQHPVAEHVNSKIVAPVITKATRKEIGQQILERGKRLAEAKGVDAPKLLLRDGDPARAIVNFARRENADLIVMGSRGLGRVEDLFAGSISYKIVHTTKKSCMVVR